MDTLEIKLSLLAREKLTINQYLTLFKINQLIKDEKPINFIVLQSDLNELEENNFLKKENNELYLTKKSNKLFSKEEDIDFEEFFNLYPPKTPNGRVLRAASKEGLRGITKDYENNYKRYIKQINDEETHNKVLEATKNMINDHVNRHAMDYLPKLETYINQNGWDKYLGKTVKKVKQNTERL